jgi:hypothetical protein
VLNPCPILPLESGGPKPSMDAEATSDFPPHLWSQMAPASRQQLSQMIAELIQHIQLPSHAKEALNEETA